MEKIKEFLQQLSSAVERTVLLAPTCIQFMGQPHRFYEDRPRDPLLRLREAMPLLVWLALLLALFQYFVISSVSEIKSPNAYAAGSMLFNVMHLLLMGVAFAIPAKLADRSTPVITHLANALCATAVLLPTAMLTLAWARMRVQSALEPNLASDPAHVGNWVVLLGYLWMAYHVYRGLRSNAQATRTRAMFATAVGLLVVLLPMQSFIASNEALMMQAVTPGRGRSS